MVKHRIKPDVFTFNILTSGYCRNFKFTFALEMFDEMRKMGCHPNVVTFNTLIRGLFRECRIDEGIGMVY
jgi:pentatricopeptide repeat protein